MRASAIIAVFAFGRSSSNRSNWEGQEENYNVFRWYRAGWGRFTQSDPILPFMHAYMTREESLRTQMPAMIGYFTNYGYVGGRPTLLDDPLGLGKIPGYGNFDVDDSCTPKQCASFWPLSEDAEKTPSTPLDPPLSPGGNMKVDAVYWKNAILKVPDNCNVKLVCKAGQPFFKFSCLSWWSNKPEKFVKGTPPPPPAEWPPFKP